MHGIALLGGYYIEVSHTLTGSKKAYRLGKTIFVSPAMYSLIQSEKGEALKRLLDSIPLVDMGTFIPNLTEMTTGR